MRLASWCLCAAVLVTGIGTAALAAENRARGDQLDQLERWCEAQTRRNELARVANARVEWVLLGQGCPSRPRGPARGERSIAP